MSTEEQKQIAQRELFELAEAKKTLAALESKGRVYGTAFRHLGEQLAPYKDQPLPRYNADLIDKAVSDYPTRDELTGVILEIRETRATIERLTKSINAMGYPI